jgi:flavin reductase (DIM6/NTAB) family NADH-FMN oxidoreductase RutF
MRDRPGAPQAVVGATVNLTAPVSFDTTVVVVSTNPAALTVESLTVPVGQSSAPLLVNVLEGGASVQVSVTLGAQILQATIVTG